MGQVVIPTSAAVNPRNVDGENFSDAIRYTDIPGLEGDYIPQGNGTSGAPLQYVEPGPVPDGPGYERLKAILENEFAEARAGNWKERGSPGNPKIIEIYDSAAGWNDGKDQSENHHMWCAGFIVWALKKAGIDVPQTMWSQTFKSYGSEVDWRDATKIRKYDIVVFKSKRRKNGGHVGFCVGVWSGGLQILGGNQGDDLNITNYSYDGRSLYITHVKRNWAIPEALDVPLSTIADTAGTDLRET